MGKNSVIPFEKPVEFEDELTALLGKGAHQLLLQAVEAELEVFLDRSFWHSTISLLSIGNT